MCSRFVQFRLFLVAFWYDVRGNPHFLSIQKLYIKNYYFILNFQFLVKIPLFLLKVRLLCASYELINLLEVILIRKMTKKIGRYYKYLATAMYATWFWGVSQSNFSTRPVCMTSRGKMSLLFIYFARRFSCASQAIYFIKFVYSIETSNTLYSMATAVHIL